MNLISDKINLIAIDDQNKWELFFKKAEDSNISQDWVYGEIKSKIGGWKVKRFEIIFEEETIALIQVYLKNILKLPFIKISYINRGPIFIKNCNDTIKMAVLHRLANEFSLRKGLLLIINPFVELSKSESLKRVFNLHYGKQFYTTSYLDLKIDSSELRKNLKSKWRNQLNSSEKNNFSVSLIVDNKYDELIFKSYKEMQASKKFAGATYIELKSIFQNFQANNRIFRFLLFDEHMNIGAFMIFLSYGNHVVYYLGWVSDDFRKMNPSNYLMWNAIIMLKENGFSKIDLGGIDSINTPGVAKFKQGIGGSEIHFPIGFFSFI